LKNMIRIANRPSEIVKRGSRRTILLNQVNDFGP
jgi:hypothetical protein